MTTGRKFMAGVAIFMVGLACGQRLQAVWTQQAYGHFNEAIAGWNSCIDSLNVSNGVTRDALRLKGRAP